MPTITVEVLQRGETRSYPYAGNAPTLVWTGAQAVLSRAMIEWLRFAHFKLEAQRIVQRARLPQQTQVLGRAPELLDLAQGPFVADAGPTLVLHPDPELSVYERAVLQLVQPRLNLTTPTTVFRQVLRDRSVAAIAAPLGGGRPPARRVGGARCRLPLRDATGRTASARGARRLDTSAPQA